MIRLEEPHLPDHLREPLLATGIYATPDEAELSQAARAGIELADRLREEPEVIAAIEHDWELADALTNLPATLAGGRRYEDAVAVGDALAVADADRALHYAAEAALAMAQAGREANARRRVTALLQAHPADAESLLAAGEVMAALGDEEAAEGHYLAALDHAYDQDDPVAATDAIERLDELRGVAEADDLGWDR